MEINPMMSGKLALGNSTFSAATEGLTRRASSSDTAQLRNVCEEFESLFIKMMLDSMRATLSDNTLIPKNSGEKLFEDNLYDEYAKKMSHTANLGIASMMYNQLSADIPGSSINISS